MKSLKKKKNYKKKKKISVNQHLQAKIYIYLHNIEM